MLSGASGAGINQRNEPRTRMHTHILRQGLNRRYIISAAQACMLLKSRTKRLPECFQRWVSAGLHEHAAGLIDGAVQLAAGLSSGFAGTGRMPAGRYFLNHGLQPHDALFFGHGQLFKTPSYISSPNSCFSKKILRT